MKRSEDISHKQIKRATINIIFLYILAIMLIIAGISYHPFFYAGAVLLIFTIIATNGLIVRKRKAKDSISERKAKKKNHPLTDPSSGIHEGIHHMNFYVEDTSSPEIQNMLYDISVSQGLFKTIDSVEFEPADKSGSMHYRVVINRKRIGCIPHEYTKEFEQYQSMPMEVAMVEVTGGDIHSDGHKFPYSCRIVLRFIVDSN